MDEVEEGWIEGPDWHLDSFPVDYVRSASRRHSNSGTQLIDAWIFTKG